MKSIKFYLIAFTVMASAAFVGCSDDDDDTMAQVRVNGVVFDNGDDFNGDVDGDFMGTGGNATRTFVWLNNLTTADYNADITASAEGTFTIIVLDANGNIVLNRSLDGASEPDSISGVTESGISGVWSVTITLGSFNGDGSFSLSEGN
ncbi:hypothetical protein [Poritiphilus flavus]|uniref:Uncharacterized protein n=1 Tax=Poritiphilus flavus TaxID=2697053 RepID=A0A6L9EGV1_9FLAO|nr:hypothetical protein [Poritiphilus flavus]NAS13852.1 hypothetical protein [Poritiphilus flavus]